MSEKQISALERWGILHPVTRGIIWSIGIIIAGSIAWANVQNEIAANADDLKEVTTKVEIIESSVQKLDKGQAVLKQKIDSESRRAKEFRDNESRRAKEFRDDVKGSLIWIRRTLNSRQPPTNGP